MYAGSTENNRSPKLKALELKTKHGEFALQQAEQVLCLLGWESTPNKVFWEAVIQHLKTK